MTPKIKLVLDNVSMGLGHPGLREMALKFGCDVKKLANNELLMFINRRKDKMKILGGNGVVLGYLRLENGRRITLEAIKFLPETFGGQGFNYDAALEKYLRSRLTLRLNQAVGPLQVFRSKKASGLTNTHGRATN